MTAVGKVIWLFAIPDPDMKKFSAALATIICVVLQLTMASVIWMSFRGVDNITLYFGFLNGKLSKAFFLLFCSMLVYPLNYEGNNEFKWPFVLTAVGLTAAASLQITKYCCKTTNDTHDEEPMTDDRSGARATSQENLI